MTNLALITSEEPFFYKGGKYPAGIYKADKESEDYAFGISYLRSLNRLLVDGAIDRNLMLSLTDDGPNGDIIRYGAASIMQEYELLLRHGYSLMDIAILGRMVSPVDTHDGEAFSSKILKPFHFDNREISDGTIFPEEGSPIIRNLVGILCGMHSLEKAQQDNMPKPCSEGLPSSLREFIEANPGQYQIDHFTNGSIGVMHMRDISAADGTEAVFMTNAKTDICLYKWEKNQIAAVDYAAPGIYLLPRNIFRSAHNNGRAYDKGHDYTDEIGYRIHYLEFRNAPRQRFILPYLLTDLVENVFAYGTRASFDFKLIQ